MPSTVDPVKVPRYRVCAESYLNEMNPEFGGMLFLNRGDNYFYFTGPGLEKWPTTSVMVVSLYQLTFEKWNSAFQELKEAAKKAGVL